MAKRNQIEVVQQLQTAKAREFRMQKLAKHHPEVKALIAENQELKETLQSMEVEEVSEKMQKKAKK